MTRENDKKMTRTQRRMFPHTHLAALVFLHAHAAMRVCLYAHAAMRVCLHAHAATRVCLHAHRHNNLIRHCLLLLSLLKMSDVLEREEKGEKEEGALMGMKG